MRRYLKVAILMSVWAAAATALGGEGRPDHVESYLGDVLIRTDDARVLVLLDTTLDASAPSDGRVDQWFILQTEKPPLMPIASRLKDALVVHSAGVLRITTADARYVFVVDGHESAGVSDGGVPPVQITGIGLAHGSGRTAIRIADLLDRGGRVRSRCDECNAFVQDPGPGGGSGTSCPSGGPGSTSCSATYGANSCSVTCSTGYYACCQALPGAAYCRCIRG